MDTADFVLPTNRSDMVLSRLTAEDDADFFAAAQASRESLARYLGGVARYKDAAAVARAREEAEKDGDLWVAIRKRDGDRLKFIGCVTAHFYRPVGAEPDRAEIDCWVASGQQGLGYGREALRATVAHLLSRCNYVFGVIDEKNTASIRAAEAAGLTFQALESPGFCRYSVTAPAVQAELPEA